MRSVMFVPSRYSHVPAHGNPSGPSITLDDANGTITWRIYWDGTAVLERADKGQGTVYPPGKSDAILSVLRKDSDNAAQLDALFSGQAGGQGENSALVSTADDGVPPPLPLTGKVESGGKPGKGEGKGKGKGKGRKKGGGQGGAGAAATPSWVLPAVAVGGLTLLTLGIVAVYVSKGSSKE